MKNENIDVEKETKNKINSTVLPTDTAKFISSNEDEKDGNFEFLCCSGGSSTGLGGGIGGHW